MISQTAEYALRAVLCLAGDPDHPLTTPEIARRSRVPAGYLAKVMQALVRARLVRSRRGKGGGFLLAGDPETVSVLSVVRVVDPLPRLHGCPLGLAAHADGLCPLHRRLDAAAASVERILAATPLASLLGETGQRTPLCLPARRNRKGRLAPAAPTRPAGRTSKKSVPPVRPSAPGRPAGPRQARGAARDSAARRPRRRSS